MKINVAIVCFLAIILLITGFGQSLAAQTTVETRVALVIGNGKYLNNTTLKNPANDAADVAAALKQTGFSVTLLVDANRPAMEMAVRDFGNALKSPQAVGLFYYSGHGAQNEGQNYLLPIDADIQDADELRYKALDAESVLAKMRSSGNKLNMVFLDACRNNPFPGATKSAERGLSVVKVEVPESVIVYATSPGSVALDGSGRNSPFTQAFLSNLKTPGQDIAIMMKQVTGSVKQNTSGAQTPWISSNLTRDFMFVAGKATALSPQPGDKQGESDWGEVVVSPGSLSLTVATAGTVTFNGKSKALPAGATVSMANVTPGDYPLSVAYADGQSETQTVRVEPGQTATVAFSYKPAPSSNVTSYGTSFTNSLGATMVWVPGGSYTMGDTAGGGDSDEKNHQVTLSGFYMGQTEVTQAQWQKVMGSNPSYFKGDSLPVENVSWYDAVALCNALSQKEGKTPAYTINGTNVTLNVGATGYRLPTEAEWEYAAKGGASTPVQTIKYAGSTNLDEVAWTSSNSGKTTHPVATRKPNALGLYDMTGNVWEWCQDWYGSYNASVQSDPTGPSSGSGRVNRGGSWNYDASIARVSFRSYDYPPDPGDDYIGFRVVLPAVQK
jgi:formylglycine-generating enzyme required for sulfatase activity